MSDLINDLRDNFGKPGYTFHSIVGDTMLPQEQWNVRRRVVKMTDWHYKAKSIKEHSIVNTIRVRRLKYKIATNLTKLKKEVTNARKQGYTITLPTMWEEQI